MKTTGLILEINHLNQILNLNLETIENFDDIRFYKNL